MRALCPVLRSIRDEKSLADAAGKSRARDRMAQSSEIGELRKVNRALEELNLEMERNAKGFSQKIRSRERVLDQVKCKEASIFKFCST